MLSYTYFVEARAFDLKRGYCLPIYIDSVAGFEHVIKLIDELLILLFLVAAILSIIFGITTLIREKTISIRQLEYREKIRPGFYSLSKRFVAIPYLMWLLVVLTKLFL